MRKVAIEEVNGKYHFELDGGIAGEYVIPNVHNRMKFRSHEEGERVIKELYTLRSFNEGERNQARLLLDKKFHVMTAASPARYNRRRPSARIDRAAPR